MTVPDSLAFLSAGPGPHPVRLLPDSGDLLHEVEFKLAIPGRDGGW